MSSYRIVVIRDDGDSVKFKPGKTGERNFINAIVEAAMPHIGTFKTAASVENAIRQGVEQAFRSVKEEVGQVE